MPAIDATARLKFLTDLLANANKLQKANQRIAPVLTSGRHAEPTTYPIVYTFETSGSHTVVTPITCTKARVQLWGGGGGGGGGDSGVDAGGGGGGGAYVESTVTVTPGSSHTVMVGISGAGGISTIDGGGGGITHWDDTVAYAQDGQGGKGSAAGGAGAIGGAAADSVGDIKFSGGHGANKVSTAVGGGGGSSAGPASDGNAASGATGGVAVSGGGAGASSSASPLPGRFPSGGGAGAGNDSTPIGSSGAVGKAIVSFSVE